MMSIINNSKAYRNLSTFDTVATSKIFPPKSLDTKQFKHFTDKYKNHYLYHRNEKSGIYTKIKTLKDGFLRVTATFSIPVLLYGSNIFQVTSDAEILRALDIVSGGESDLLNKTFDAANMETVRVDGNGDFFVPPFSEYFKALSHHELPTLTRRIFPFNPMTVNQLQPYLLDLYSIETISFQNGTRSITAYDKKTQSDDKYEKLLKDSHLTPKQIKIAKRNRDFADGIFRVENSERKDALNASILKFHKTERKTAKNVLTMEFADFLVEKALKELYLNKDIPTFDEYQQQILDIFSNTKTANTLIRFMTDVSEVGINTAKRKFDKADYRIRQLKEADIFRTYFAEKKLPALTVFGNDNEAYYL